MKIFQFHQLSAEAKRKAEANVLEFECIMLKHLLQDMAHLAMIKSDKLYDEERFEAFTCRMQRIINAKKDPNFMYVCCFQNNELLNFVEDGRFVYYLKEVMPSEITEATDKFLWFNSEERRLG